MNNNDKLEQLKQDGALIYSAEITDKEVKEYEKSIQSAKKKDEKKVKIEVDKWKKEIEEDIKEYNLIDNYDIIYHLSTEIFDAYNSVDIYYLLIAIKELFPDIYTDVLEGFILGNHDT